MKTEERYVLTARQQKQLDKIVTDWKRVRDPNVAPVTPEEIIDLLLEWELHRCGLPQ